MRIKIATNFPRPLQSILKAKPKGFGSKVKDRIREWLDELLPVVPPPVPCPVPVRDDGRKR